MSELNRLSKDEFREAEKLPVVLVLDNVRSAYNVGSVFRTADAFRVQAIHLCGISARPPHKDIHKTALGATESVEWHYFEDVAGSLAKLKDEGYHIVAVEQAEPKVFLTEWSASEGAKLALIFGHEVTGVSEKALEYAAECIEIPQFGIKHSLNVAISAGIVLWELSKKFNKHSDP